MCERDKKHPVPVLCKVIDCFSRGIHKCRFCGYLYCIVHIRNHACTIGVSRESNCWFCKFCGAINADCQLFCTSCGVKKEEAEEN